MDGKFLRIGQSMYNGIKSCVKFGKTFSRMFPCEIVRQGESLSPLLFSLYVNDLEIYMKISTRCNGVDSELFENDFVSFMKLFA